MHFEPDNIYHVYNRGNNKIPLFFNSTNYLFLLKKIRNEWLDFCNIFCYCLMPNHFHFMIEPKAEGCKSIILKEKTSHLQILSKTIGKTLSSYTQAINIQNNTIGNLFQKKTKAKCLTNEFIIIEPCYTYIDYLLNCFHYIHQNPVRAKIVTNPKCWPYSSWLDYYGFRNGTLCNKQIAMEKMGLSHLDFRTFKEFKTDAKIIAGIW